MTHISFSPSLVKLVMMHCADRLKEHSYYISIYMSICYCCLVGVVVVVVVAAAAVAVIARCCLDVLSPPAAQYKNIKIT